MMTTMFLAALGPIVASKQSDRLHLPADPQERLLSQEYEWRWDMTSCPKLWTPGTLPDKKDCYKKQNNKWVDRSFCPIFKRTKVSFCPKPEYKCGDFQGDLLADDEWEKVSLGWRNASKTQRKEACKTKAIKKGMNWMLVRNWGKLQCYHSYTTPRKSKGGKNGYAGCGMIKWKSCSTIEIGDQASLVDQLKLQQKSASVHTRPVPIGSYTTLPCKGSDKKIFITCKVGKYGPAYYHDENYGQHEYSYHTKRCPTKPSSSTESTTTTTTKTSTTTKLTCSTVDIGDQAPLVDQYELKQLNKTIQRGTGTVDAAEAQLSCKKGSKKLYLKCRVRNGKPAYYPEEYWCSECWIGQHFIKRCPTVDMD